MDTVALDKWLKDCLTSRRVIIVHNRDRHHYEGRLEQLYLHAREWKHVSSKVSGNSSVEILLALSEQATNL